MFAQAKLQRSPQFTKAANGRVALRMTVWQFLKKTRKFIGVEQDEMEPGSDKQALWLLLSIL